jgi:hypothetical protein
MSPLRRRDFAHLDSISRERQDRLHRPWPAGPFWLLPGTAVVVAAIAFLTIELPTRHALRTPPAHALTRD